MQEELDRQYAAVDDLEAHLAHEYESGRLFRLSLKLAQIIERPEVRGCLSCRSALCPLPSNRPLCQHTIPSQHDDLGGPLSTLPTQDTVPTPCSLHPLSHHAHTHTNAPFSMINCSTTWTRRGRSRAATATSCASSATTCITRCVSVCLCLKGGGKRERGQEPPCAHSGRVVCVCVGPGARVRFPSDLP